MRYSFALALLMAVPFAFASQPGQPLDCSDWILLEPGHTCTVISPIGTLPPDSPWLVRGSNTAVDNDGRTLMLRANWTADTQLRRLGLYAFDGTAETLVAYIEDRYASGPGGTKDQARATSCTIGVNCGGTGNCGSLTGICRAPQTLSAGLCEECGNPAYVIRFDPVRGRLLIPLKSLSADASYSGWWIAAIGGFTTLYDIQQSFVPPADTQIGFRTPVMPDGLGGADRFDTYWGEITQPLDLANAHPLQCAYPVVAPNAGDYLTITTPVPTPAAGAANYVLTSVAYQGETRAGRRASGGKQMGRDASRLPRCGESITLD